MIEQIQCEACEEQAIRRISLRFSPTKSVPYDAYLKHSLMAINDLFKFLKHTRKKSKRMAA